MITCKLGDKTYTVDYVTGRALREIEPAAKMYTRISEISEAAVKGETVENPDGLTMKTAYSGWVDYNGRHYVVTPEKSFGYADKNWGRDFTSPWVWLASSCLTSKKTGKPLLNSAFDIGGGRPKIYFVPLDRRLLGVFYYEGKEYDFNFSKLHLRVRTEFSFEERDDVVVWHVRQENIHAAMETEICCRKADMLFVNYEAPDGSKKHNRLWNGGTGWGTVKLYEKKDGELVMIDEIEATHVGCEYGEYDEPALQEIGLSFEAGLEPET